MDNLIVHNLIVHELKKQPESAESELVLSKEPLPISEQAIELIGRLDQIFERKNDLLQGFLSEPDESLFPAYYENWLMEGRDRSHFITFSEDTMKVLQQSLNGVIGAKGGYLLYADYTMEEQRMLGIFLIRETPGMIFVPNESGEALKLSLTQYLDVDHMAMAVRLLAGNGRNVQMIRHARTQSSISQYFTEWVGLDRPETSAELTQNFLEMVEELPVPKDRDTGFAMNEGDFEKALVKYAVKQPQQTIRAKEFDEFFYGNEKPLQEMLENGDGVLDEGFRVDKRSLRQRFYLKAGFGGMSISCTKDHFRDGNIEVNEETGVITIKNPELASLLLDQKGE